MENKKLLVYPAVFEKENEEYNVTFPDVPAAITCGDSIEQAVEMAQSALGLVLYEDNEYPEPSDPKTINVNDNSFVSLISLDIDEYRRKNHSKTVRKNTSIPEWLNVIAEKEHINFSQTLTEALKEKLSV